MALAPGGDAEKVAEAIMAHDQVSIVSTSGFNNW